MSQQNRYDFPRILNPTEIPQLVEHGYRLLKRKHKNMGRIMVPRMVITSISPNFDALEDTKVNQGEETAVGLVSTMDGTTANFKLDSSPNKTGYIGISLIYTGHRKEESERLGKEFLRTIEKYFASRTAFLTR